MRSFLRASTLAMSVLLLLVGTVAPALGHEHRVTDREFVFDGLVHERFSIRLSADGAVARGNILRFPQDHQYLELRSTLARDRVAGLETMPDLWARVRGRNGLAGTNGGFGLPRPFGAPNGFAVQDGALVGGHGQTLNGFRRTRGTVGVQPSGALLLDRLRTTVDLRNDTTGELKSSAIDEVNLQPRLDGEVNVPNGELIIYNRLFGTSINVPDGSRVIVVEGLRLRPSGWSTGTVREVHHVRGDTTWPNPSSGTSVLLAHGTAVDRVQDVLEGVSLSVRSRPAPLSTDPAQWGQVGSSVPGGPLLIRNGTLTRDTDWHDEGFNRTGSLVVHRHPRTAIGLTAGGEVLMVTVDGRRAGHSVGMTMRELQRFMNGLGARHALNLDGGGSTTMVTDGRIANRPSESGRSVPNALFVHHSYPFDGTSRISGGNRFATAGAISRRSHPDGADHVVIATGAAFPDALAGGPFATHRDAPLLLTERDRLPGATQNALDRLQPQSATILGGTAAISNQVRDQLEARGISVRRIRGADRTETAAAIARRMVGNADLDRVFLATGAGFADALSAAAPAGMMNAPILLTGRDELPAPTRDFLSQRQVDEVVIVGGTGVVTGAVEDEVRSLRSVADVGRLSGRTRYGTARAVNEWAASHVPTHGERGLLVANGNNFPDALAGGPLGAKRTNLLMIVPPRDVRTDDDAAAYLDARGDGALERITLLGGRSALNSYQQWQLDQIAIR